MRPNVPEPDILVENRQRGHCVDTARCARLVAWLARRARRVRPAGSPPWSAVTVLLVGDRGSAAAHRRVFGDPSATDVITLSYEDGPGEAPGLSGELIVNVERAHEEGTRRAAGRPGRVWGPDYELALYLAHGIDHLTGADDHEEADFLRMRSRDLRWVAAAAKEGLVALFASLAKSMPSRPPLHEAARETPVVAAYDIIVAGGGVGGVAAALAAARSGASVCLLERTCALGGLATLGNVIDWLPLCDGRGRQVIAGLSEELLRRVVHDVRRDCWPARFERFPACWEPGGTEEERRRHRLRACFNPDTALLVFEELLVAEGVALRYDARVVGVARRDNRITHLFIEDKDGRSALACGAVVDATGDADVCAAAGERTASFARNVAGGWYYTVRDGGDFTLRYGSEDDRPVNRTGPFFRGDSAADVSAFLLAARKRLRDGLANIREGDPGADIQPFRIPTFPCLLKTRRLVGAATLADSDRHRWRDDAVCLCGDWREAGPVWAIPFGALTGVANANLAACGRCISAAEDVWDATRVIPVCAVTGEAAGIAAAFAVLRNGGSVATLPPGDVAAEMRSRGNLLSPALVAEGAV